MWKTSQARSRHRKGKISDASSPLAELGYCLSPRFLTLNISGAPSTPKSVLSGHLGDDSSVAVLFDAKACPKGYSDAAKIGRPPVTDEGSLREASTHTPCTFTTEEVTLAATRSMIKSIYIMTICCEVQDRLSLPWKPPLQRLRVARHLHSQHTQSRSTANLTHTAAALNAESASVLRLPGRLDEVSAPNGKPVNNTQHKVLGNSMAVPVMRWIGARILLVEGATMLTKEERRKSLRGKRMCRGVQFFVRGSFGSSSARMQHTRKI